MQKIENFAQISDLLNAQLKKGVITNNFLRGDDYTREIANGLYIHEAGGALLLFRERGDHLVMTFYLHPNAVLSLPETDRPVVTELSCRAKDADAMANAAEQFCALGFREVLRRTRRSTSRKPRAQNCSPAVCRLRTICAKTSQTAKPLSPGTKKVFPVCCILRFPAPRPRFGTLPCVRTAAEKVLPANCSLRILRQRTVQKVRYGRGPAMLLPSIFTNNTAIGPTDGLPPCCNIIKGEIDHERKNYRNSE